MFFFLIVCVQHDLQEKYLLFVLKNENMQISINKIFSLYLNPIIVGVLHKHLKNH